MHKSASDISNQLCSHMNPIIDRLTSTYPELETTCESINNACTMIINCYKGGGKLLLCGNGGSAADCEHIVGELMKEFTIKRPLPKEMRTRFENVGANASFTDKLQGALSAIALTGHPALSTAFQNDANPEFLFAQQVYGLGREGDVLLAISTSGNAANVINAVYTAKALDMHTVALTGRGGGGLAKLCDVAICVPADVTYRIQEYHLPVYHAMCEIIEKIIFT